MLLREATLRMHGLAVHAKPLFMQWTGKLQMQSDGSHPYQGQNLQRDGHELGSWTESDSQFFCMFAQFFFLYDISLVCVHLHKELLFGFCTICGVLQLKASQASLT